MFCQSHWILAVFYFKIAKNMPAVIERGKKAAKDYKTLYRIGLAANTILPILACVTWIGLAYSYYVKDNIQKAIRYATALFVV